MHQHLHCPQCGYDLTGLPENRCPECGVPFDPAGLRRLRASAISWTELLIRLVGPPAIVVLCASLAGACWGGLALLALFVVGPFNALNVVQRYRARLERDVVEGPTSRVRRRYILVAMALHIGQIVIAVVAVVVLSRLFKFTVF